MNERADFKKNYLMRYSVMALICWGSGLWFAYDGLIGYPKGLPAAEAYDPLRQIEDAEERFDRWQALATENGWSPSVPKQSAEELREKIRGQFFYMIPCFVGGILALFYYFSCRGSWVEPTPNGLTTSWGQSLNFSDVTLLNKKRWSNKGIAKATYNDLGTRKSFVFDDFKFEREPIGKMLRTLESVLKREQIVGGPTEEETDAEKARSEEHQSEEPDHRRETDRQEEIDSQEDIQPRVP